MNQTQNNRTCVSVRSLKKYFPIRSGFFSRVKAHVKAVDDVSFDIFPKKTLALVGESGCGKTTIGRTMLRLIQPTSGDVFFNDNSIFKMNHGEMKKMRKQMQIIFQDPFSSLNPRMTVGSIIAEGLVVHKIGTRQERLDRARELLRVVGLSPDYHNRYPHEFSGGQRQRIGIARAIALNPSFIVCDEPVSALDVSVQAQIINLLEQLQEELGLSYLFISHDLSVVRHISDFVAVMYLGRIVEYAPCDELFDNPLHPYTQALLSAIPLPDPKSGRQRIILKGDVPSPVNPPSGCYFHPRCPKAVEDCKHTYPDLEQKNDRHYCACLRVKNTIKESLPDEI